MVTVTNDAMEPFALGTTDIKWYVSDAAGNTIIVTQSVTVTNETPVADAGQDQGCRQGEGPAR